MAKPKKSPFDEMYEQFPYETPLTKEIAIRNLNTLSEAFENGHKLALMAALNLCAQYYLPMPDWVSRAYCEAYQSVRRAKIKSWDEAFGPPHAPGAHIDRIAKRNRDRFRVWHEAENMRTSEPKRSIDDSFFAELASRLALGQTVTRELYYEVKRYLESE